MSPSFSCGHFQLNFVAGALFCSTFQEPKRIRCSGSFDPLHLCQILYEALLLSKEETGQSFFSQWIISHSKIPTLSSAYPALFFFIRSGKRNWNLKNLWKGFKKTVVSVRIGLTNAQPEQPQQPQQQYTDLIHISELIANLIQRDMVKFWESMSDLGVNYSARVGVINPAISP